ncbi:alcohol dehydrogenase catalytic domain-containing protein [Photobacterium rosenbergii]|uniref:Alcohol dehydrogenase catalytic domain-containing protein n=1 Tax=Photobacterium rosenbergii TaxID=294936 RepID=A0ABU3ZDY5_9GAMM|nr:alcohol dehydrogenase catalytic domain-containing protein [Photobacterium rosenbergii]MDV5168218.1 alcohol dehydrogenase catalytic domain-containing protein [Photobacterium rosenbergii]
MTSRNKAYQQPDQPIPATTMTWNMYGAGLDSIGKDNRPETFPVPEPSDDQLLIRVDAVGLCFSDVKLINQGSTHPKLYNRDLRKEPTRLGHEATITIMKVGKHLANQFKAGERYAVQPDIYQNGKSTAYGYTIPGGLTQFHLIGPEMLQTDAGACLLKVSDELAFGESALLEPWGCVWASYTQRRRLAPKQGGVMWIVGQPGDTGDYQFSAGLASPGTVVLTQVPDALRTLVESQASNVLVRDDIDLDSLPVAVDELTGGAGFDDIVVLSPRSASALTTIAKYVARRGTMNMVGDQPLDGLVDADVGRLHYDYVAFIGNSGRDIADSYGDARNRCDLRKGGLAVFVGAGGPMGQMHVQRAIELQDGPAEVIVTDINDQRLAEIESRFASLTEANNCKLYTYNPTSSDISLPEFVSAKSQDQGADDVVVCVPNAGIMAEAATFMKDDGMLVLFAGVPNGTLAPLDFSSVYLSNAQYTGTSGLTIDDQTVVMDNALSGNIAPAVCVAAIGGMNVAKEGIQAMIDARYPGKILIFPQLEDLPLLGLDELAEKLPDVAKALGKGNTWNFAAEQALFEAFNKPSS